MKKKSRIYNMYLVSFFVCLSMALINIPFFPNMINVLSCGVCIGLAISSINAYFTNK
uniref:Uncharacterized protein n=1 Tax=viral metagenome TaxID=1070528 RepID=A0A6M3LKP2_9ZZZZ